MSIHAFRPEIVCVEHSVLNDIRLSAIDIALLVLVDYYQVECDGSLSTMGVEDLIQPRLPKGFSAFEEISRLVSMGYLERRQGEE